MDTHITKTLFVFLKVLGFLASALLTIFAGVFGLLAIVALIQSITNPSIFSFIGCAACSVFAWMFWSIRKDTLV